METVLGVIGLGNGKMPRDSKWSHKDCSKDIWGYRGPTFGIPPIGLTLCGTIGFNSKSVELCVGFVVTNDGFFIPHWSYSNLVMNHLLSATAYLNLWQWATSGAALLKGTHEFEITFP